MLRCIFRCSFDDPGVFECHVEEIDLALSVKEVMDKTGEYSAIKTTGKQDSNTR